MMRIGHPPEVVAEIMGVSRTSVFEWQRKYREGGPDALATKPTPGRPPTLSDRQMIQLRSLIVGNDPRDYGFREALWTRRIVAALIYRSFGERVSPMTAGRILGKLGLSPQRPLYRARQRDPEKVREWKEHTYPEIRETATETGARILFADEAGVRTDHHGGATWAPIGRTPVVEATGERKSVNMVSAIDTTGEIYFDVFTESMNAGRFIEFCRKLLEDCPAPVFLVLDRATYHTAGKVRDYVASTGGRLSLFYLPSYSPDLNPDEWVWNNVKNTRIYRRVAMSHDHLHALACDALEELRELPETIRGFFRDPDLAYINA